MAESELTGRIKNSTENFNLAEKLDPQLLKEIGQEVCTGFQDDEQSRSEWLEKHSFWLSLYMQDDYAENSDPERSWGATESVPILTEACNQFQARTYKSFFPNDTFVDAVPMRRTAQDRKIVEERAQRVGRHMAYQLGFQDRSYKQDKDALFLGTAVHGSFFTKTYFSQKYRRFKVDNVRPTDLVINYNVGPIRIEDCRRKTHIIYTTVGETEDMVRTGYLTEAARPAESKIDDRYNIKVDQVQGITLGNSSIKRDRQAVLLEQQLYLDLDDNGFFKPYLATVCAASRNVLRLTINWEADKAGMPLKDYEQEQFYTHYKYQENPDGFYGLGLGHTIGDLNSAINIMLRQSMDAATLANDGNMSGFISERMGVEGDEVRLTIGKLRKIPDTVGDLTNSIMLMKFPGPNVAMLQIMQQLDLRAQRLGSTTEATTGTTDKVLQPTTLLSQIEQALEQFSSVQMRLANSLSEELQKIYRINRQYLPLVEAFAINGVPEHITRADYADDMLIQPVFDPKYSTQSQKVARAQAELDATLQNPINQNRPMVIDAAFRRYFEALDVEDIDELIPPQPQVENFDDQITENMFFLMPPEARPLFDVFPDQNHQMHLMQLQQFVAQYGQTLQPEQVDAIVKHQMKHQSYLYGQMNGIIPTQAGQTPTPPLEARTGNDMGDGAAIAAIPPAQAAGLADFLGVGDAGNGPSAGAGGNPQVM